MAAASRLGWRQPRADARPAQYRKPRAGAINAA